MPAPPPGIQDAGQPEPTVEAGVADSAPSSDEPHSAADGGPPLPDADLQPNIARGEADPDFGHLGLVVSQGAPGSNGLDVGEEIVLTLDTVPAIVVAGISESTSSLDMAMWGFGPNGQKTDTFGQDGMVISDGAVAADADEAGLSAAIDNEKRLYVCGRTGLGPNQAKMTVWRFDLLGAPDSTFGSDGVVSIDNLAGGNGNDYAWDLLLDNQSNVLVVGRAVASSSAEMFACRFDEFGTRDPLFADNGCFIDGGTAGGKGLDEAFGIIQVHNGPTVVAGHSHNSGRTTSLVLWGLDRSGGWASDFGTNGLVIESSPDGGDLSGFELAEDRHGRIVVVGQGCSTIGNRCYLTVRRFLGDGTPDGSFNNVDLPGPNDSAEAAGEAVAIDPLGNIVVAGWFHNGVDHDAAVWRFTPAGGLDSSFGESGIWVHASANDGDDEARDVAIADDGRIFVTGQVFNGTDADMALWCLR